MSVPPPKTERVMAPVVPAPVRASGTHLYRYSSFAHPEWLQVILLEHELYLPSLNELNDPADGRPRLAQLSEAQIAQFLIADLQKRNPHFGPADLAREEAIIKFNVHLHGPQAMMREMSRLLNAELAGYRIYSLSRRYDNLSLWAHYAAKGTGYCLEFTNSGPLFERAMDVIYGDGVEMDVTNPQHRNGFWFFCKRLEWSTEEEVRLVLPRNRGTKVKIEPSWLSRIILGPSMPTASRSQIRAWADERVPELAVVDAYYDDLQQRLMLKP